MSMSWTIYMLALNNNAFYTGITNNLERRMLAHQSGRGSKCVRAHLPFRVIYVEEALDRSEAARREWAIKQLARPAKEKILKSSIEGKISLICDDCGVVILLRQSNYLEPAFDFGCMVCGHLIHYEKPAE